jgi:hypothetical protein
MSQGIPGVVKYALISGAVFGFLGGAPFVSMLNCVCCALIIGSGFLAAMLSANESKSLGVQFTPGNGAVVGFVTGVVYGVADTITATISGLLFQEAAVEWMLDALELIDDLPPEVIDLITGQSSLGLAASIVLGLIIKIGFGIIFATLGGLIGGAVFKSEPAAPAPPVTPPAQA